MKSIDAIAGKFKSGNSIPCKFARVYLHEWEDVLQEVKVLELRLEMYKTAMRSWLYDGEKPDDLEERIAFDKWRSVKV